jgi:hypothetical protein
MALSISLASGPTLYLGADLRSGSAGTVTLGQIGLVVDVDIVKFTQKEVD